MVKATANAPWRATSGVCRRDDRPDQGGSQRRFRSSVQSPCPGVSVGHRTCPSPEPLELHESSAGAAHSQSPAASVPCGALPTRERKGPASLQAPEKVARPAGFEPTTPWFVAKYSIQLSYGRVEARIVHVGASAPLSRPAGQCRKKKRPITGAQAIGGDGRIRTVDARFCAHAPLAGECLRPLGHVSVRSVAPVCRPRSRAV